MCPWLENVQKLPLVQKLWFSPVIGRWWKKFFSLRYNVFPFISSVVPFIYDVSSYSLSVHVPVFTHHHLLVFHWFMCCLCWICQCICLYLCGIFICDCVCVSGPGVLWFLCLCVLVVVLVVQGPGWIAWTLKPCMCLQNRLDSPHSPSLTLKSPPWLSGGKEPSAYSSLLSYVWGTAWGLKSSNQLHIIQPSMTNQS